MRAGMGSGCSSAATPRMPSTLKMLLPRTLPTATSACCRRAAMTPTASSGREVPTATSVSPMTASERPAASAMPNHDVAEDGSGCAIYAANAASLPLSSPQRHRGSNRRLFQKHVLNCIRTAPSLYLGRVRGCSHPRLPLFILLCYSLPFPPADATRAPGPLSHLSFGTVDPTRMGAAPGAGRVRICSTINGVQVTEETACPYSASPDRAACPRLGDCPMTHECQ